MNEPLTNSTDKINFTGKTYNKHPQWYNQPLRLTKEQKQDPLPVLDDFFECYHLNEVRQTFWEWLSEVVSSSRSISGESNDRSNHFYFYEKIEGVVEAAFIIKKRMHKHRRRNHKRLLKKRSQLKDVQSPSIKENLVSNSHIQSVESIETGEVLNKPKRLIDYVNDDPLYVINKVFRPDKLVFIIEEVREWLFIGLSVDCTVYDDGDHRSNLIVFHDQLILLIEALFVINLRHIDDAEQKEKLSSTYNLAELNTFQIGDPEQVLAAFFEKYPAVYIMRELDDWYEASVSYAGEWRGNVICLQQVWDIYRNVQCLIKSAERLLSRTNFQI